MRGIEQFHGRLVEKQKDSRNTWAHGQDVNAIYTEQWAGNFNPKMALNISIFSIRRQLTGHVR